MGSRRGALRWHWSQLFQCGLMWFRPEERWDVFTSGVSWVKEIVDEKRWPSVLTGPTQHFNHLAPILRFILPSQLPKAASQHLKIIFYLSGFHFPFIFSCPSASCLSICFALSTSFTLFPSCCPLFITYWPSPVTPCASHPISISMSQCGIYEDKCDPQDTWYCINFPAKVNLPACNEDRSSLRCRERWKKAKGREGGHGSQQNKKTLFPSQ